MFEAKNSKDDTKEKLYDTRQLVYKVLANSLYGALGNKVFRFFNVDSAKSITLSGQEAIKNVMVSAEDYIECLKKDKVPEINFIRKDQMYKNDSDSFDIATFKHIVTGDTDSIFLTYENILDKNKEGKERLDIIDDLNKKVQNYLNNDLMNTIVKKHNVDESKNRLVLKNELVIKRGLYLAKKRYVNYVISQEGNPVDEVKAMGLETKRSDFSILTKDYLKEVIDLIIKSKILSVPKIVDFVKEKEKIFLKAIASGITNIGRPVSFSKKLKEYKVLPQGVRGMLAWNDLEYKTFDVGSRGYLFKLKGIDLDKAPEEIRLNYDKNFLKKGVKLDVLVVPEEVSNVPPYYIIDVKTMLDFTWTDRYNLLISPLIIKKQEILKF